VKHVTKQEAIKRLKERINRIRQVKATARFGYTFTKWRQDTESLIKLIFPGERDRVHAFTSIKYDPDLTSGLNPVEDETHCQRSYIVGLERAEAVLQSFIDEINDTSTMVDWRKLEKDFRDIPDPFSDMRADWSDQPGLRNYWQLAGGIDTFARARFEALARQAGRFLLASNVAIGKCSSDLRSVEDDMARWLTAVREITRRFDFGPIATLFDANNASIGHVSAGSINQVIEASALLCFQLSTEETVMSSDTGSESRPSGARIELIMGDKYQAVQAGAMGPGAHAHDINFSQVWNQLSASFDLTSLANELSKLRVYLKEKATDAEHDITVGSLALAEQAAKKGDGSKTLEYLAKTGKWVLDAATQIGATLAAEAIKKSLGM